VANPHDDDLPPGDEPPTNRFSHLTPKYGRGFLVVRLEFYKRRGGDAYTISQVRGSIPLAKRCGVADNEIADLLHEYGLSLETVRDHD
jgi:hypothetical protein